MYVHVGFVSMFDFVEMDFCDLQFSVRLCWLVYVQVYM